MFGEDNQYSGNNIGVLVHCLRSSSFWEAIISRRYEEFECHFEVGIHHYSLVLVTFDKFARFQHDHGLPQRNHPHKGSLLIMKRSPALWNLLWNLVHQDWVIAASNDLPIRFDFWQCDSNVTAPYLIHVLGSTHEKQEVSTLSNVSSNWNSNKTCRNWNSNIKCGVDK